MTAAPSRRAKELFLDVLELHTSERAAFLDTACATDAALRAQVEALLDSFANSNATQEMLGLHAVEPDHLEPGTLLMGRYAVAESIGAGGMGEVHRARDSRLERDVAIKVLSAAYAANPSVRQRFEREMRSVAAFSHPNVVEIHDLGDHGETRFAVMELVEGRELRQLILKGLSVEQAVEIAFGVAAALAAANRHGLIHRDIKPENVMVSPEGHVKVLDFGLARPEVPTEEQALTQASMMLGTVPYMSPEQAGGRELDWATDVFSLGTVLFEMLSGQNPFAGSSMFETLRRVGDASPPSLAELRPDAPDELIALVARMLSKAPSERPPAQEVALRLQALRAGLTGDAPGPDDGRLAPQPMRTGGATAPSCSMNPPETRYARCGDIHLAYQVFGDGPLNLLVVPGFISNVDNCWACPEHADWLRTLGSFARVAIFDKRGTGLSDRVSDLPDMEARVEDVCTVMDAAGFETAALLGISEGGSLACVFAASHPQRCLALLLHGSFARFESWFATSAELEQLFDYIRSAWGTGSSLPGFAPSKAGDAEFQEWWGKFERLGANPGAAIDLMRMNSQIDVTRVLPAIQAPTLVIHRAEDVLIDPDASRQLAAAIPSAKLHSSPSSDHIPWVGEPVAAELAAVREFLQGVPDLDTRKFALASVLVIQLPPDSSAADSLATHPTHTTTLRIREQLELHHGSPMSTCPGGFVATFDGPARAIRCAKAISASTSRTRICVHLGEVAISRETTHGAAVDVAIAVAAKAGDGEVLVTRIVRDLVAGSGLRFTDAPEPPHLPAVGELFRVC